MIRIYKNKEIEILRQSGRRLAEAIAKVKKETVAGVTTEYLNKVAEDLIFSVDAEPSFKGYQKFPAALCVSLNEEIVHGVPSQRKLVNGDLVSLDLGLRFKGYCTDMAITLAIGSVPKEVKKLIWVTKEALGLAIDQVKPGNHLGDIGQAIERYVTKNGLSVVRELVGHGVGKKVHEEPEVLNYGSAGEGPELKKGMVLAIEPMVTMGAWRIRRGLDGFSYLTADGSLSAHFEATVVVTDDGVEVLTKIEM